MGFPTYEWHKSVNNTHVTTESVGFAWKSKYKTVNCKRLSTLIKVNKTFNWWMPCLKLDVLDWQRIICLLSVLFSLFMYKIVTNCNFVLSFHVLINAYQFQFLFKSSILLFINSIEYYLATLLVVKTNHNYM